MLQLRPLVRTYGRRLRYLTNIRPRVRRQIVRFLRLLALTFIFLFVVAFVTPARNFLGYYFIPSSWVQLSSGRIIQMFYLEEQSIPVELGDSVTCDSVQAKMKTVDWDKIVSELNDFPAYDSAYFSNIAAHPEIYGTSPEEVQGLQDKYPGFKPPMSAMWQKKLRMTFKVFSTAMKLFNVTWFLSEGTMLGAYRHHGYIPWDDDMDICMNGSDWLRVKQILHCIPDFDVDTSSYMMYKFFWKQSDLIVGGDFLRVPYIDIFFFTEDEEYIWSLSAIKKHRILFKKSDIFPLQLRPFEDSLCHVPKTFEIMSTTLYDPITCVSRDYDHLKGRVLIPFYEYEYIKCSIFKSIYPFVERKNVTIKGRPAVIEYKVLGKKVLSNFTVLL